MSAFDPPDSPSLPAVVRAYVRARRRWVAVYCDERRDDAAWEAFGRASEALGAELAARGGRWTIGNITYILEAPNGIAIEQEAAASGEGSPAPGDAALDGALQDGAHAAPE